MNCSTKKIGLLKFAGFIAVLTMLYYVVPILWNFEAERMQKEKLLEDEKQTKEQLEKYFSKLTTNEANLSIPQNWEDVLSDGTTMYATIDNTRVWTECSDHVVLKGNGVERYVTEAPRGELIAYQGAWYIANVSKSFSDRTHVVNHIKNCINELDKHYQEKIKLEQKNRKSFEM